MKRNKIWAILGAAVLTVGVAGIAFANTLSVDKPNMAGSTLGDLVADQGVVEDCSDFVDGLEVGEGEVGIHFILTTPEAESGNISGSVDGTPFGPVANTVHGGGNGAMHFYVVVAGDADSVIDDATTDINGGILTISHVCFGAPEATPTFEQSEEGETDAPSVPVTDAPSFEQSQEGDTDAPSEPSTDALGTNGTSAPADGAWLLVVALGVLLASIVVLTPARAKGKR
ncbi:MAG TPA: hypothetical protein VM451_09500 [Candidatus Limnocylindria bacterium]|nr:hypothetical protein [Candidatus Limnocylindria bacterium]